MMLRVSHPKVKNCNIIAFSEINLGLKLAEAVWDCFGTKEYSLDQLSSFDEQDVFLREPTTERTEITIRKVE